MKKNCASSWLFTKILSNVFRTSFQGRYCNFSEHWLWGCSSSTMLCCVEGFTKPDTSKMHSAFDFFNTWCNVHLL